MLGEQEVREAPVGLPDLVQHDELGGGVEAQVADELADVGPVLLLDVGPVVLVDRAAPREGDLVVEAVLEQMGVDER